MPRKSKHNVFKFIDKYYPEAKLVSDSKEFAVQCPWHEGSKRKLYIHAETGVFNCFVCGEKGSFYDLVRRTLNLNRDEVYQIAGGFNESDDEITTIEESASVSPSFTIPYPDHYYGLYGESIGSEGTKALEYLYGRGITDKQIAYYKLGFCLEGRYAGRVIIPTFDRYGNLVTYAGRDYTGNQMPKVLNNPAVPGTHGSKDWVFNLYNALRTDHLIVTEGPFDAMACGVSGVCIFGKGITETQIMRLVLDKPKRITVCLDADASFDNEKLAQTLSSLHSNIYVASLPYGDPDSVPKGVLADCIKGAEKYVPKWVL